MHGFDRLNSVATERIMQVVSELQPVTPERVAEELDTQYGAKVDIEQLVHYMEWLRSGFPRKLAHAGPDAWIVVDLG